MATDEASTRFPFINLEKSLFRAGQMFANDKNGKPMAVPTAFECWGYSPKSSGGFQTISALKNYGLLEDEGANADRRVKLTALARRYFLDERDDTRAKMLSTFALTPALFKALWEQDKWSDGIPADMVARSHLKLERSLSDQSARALLGIFKDNITFAGLRASDQESEVVKSMPPAWDILSPFGPAKGKEMENAHPSGASMPERREVAERSAKPIVFDMETVTVSATFDNVEDLNAFIEKLQKLAPLMPTKH